MTIPVSDRLSQLYVGNGTNKRFDFTFRVFQQEDETGVSIRKKGAVEFETLDPSTYVVQINQDDMGGYVTFNTAPESGTYFYIAGTTSLDQLLDITNYDNFYPDAIERALDKLTALLQERITEIDQEKQSRILADLKYDALAMEREDNLENRLTSYINAMLGVTNPAIFDGISDRMIITKDGRTQREFNESIPFWTDEFVKFMQETYLREEQILDHVEDQIEAEKTRAQAAETTLDGKIETEKTRALAAESQLNSAIGAVSNGYYKSYATLTAANADIANIPLSVSVKVLSSTDGGEYYKASAGATSLTKSPYDPVAIAAADAASKANAAENNAKQFTTQYFVNLGLYSGKIPAEYDQNGIVLRYFDNSGNMIVSGDLYANGVKLAGLPKNVSYSSGLYPAQIASDNIMPMSFDKYGRMVATPHPYFAKQVINLAGSELDTATLVSDDSIVLYGDSLTGSGSGYGDSLSAELSGRTVTNKGIGGQDTLNIVQRQGGAPIPVAAFTMPVSGSVTVTLTNGDPYYSVAGSYPAKINGISVTVSSTATQNQWTVTRVNAGDTVNIPAGSLIVLDEQEDFRNRTLILQPGPNFGSPSVSPTRQQMRQYIDLTASAIAHLTPKIKKFAIIGDYCPAVPNEDKTKLRDHVVLYNTMLKEVAGQNYIDWHDYGVTQAVYDGVALGLIASVTSQDIADMAAGFVPNSLTVDGIHPNSAFKTLLAKRVALNLKIRGI